MTIAEYCAGCRPVRGRYYLTPMGGWPWNAAEAYAGFTQMRNSGIRWFVHIGQNTYLYCEDFRIDTVMLSGDAPFDPYERYPAHAEYDYSIQSQRVHQQKMNKYLTALKKGKITPLTRPVIRVYRPVTKAWRVVRQRSTV